MVDAMKPPDEMSFLVSITGNMSSICAAALQEISLLESDKGVAALVIKYASEIDNGNMSTLAKFGPLLLQAMESLQMTPRARAQAAKGGSNGKPVNPKFDELRQRRAARANGTKNIHSASS